VTEKSFGELIRSAEQSPSYWMQVALLEFLQSLEAMMAARGDLSRKALAELVGVSPATLSRWLNGSENLTVGTMCRLAVAMGAAVHIHVADKNDRGRWRPEVGAAGTEKRQKAKRLPDAVTNITTFKAKREAQSESSIIVTSDSGMQGGLKAAVASYSRRWRTSNG
jgi:transcriptional regulator with XRE-family HTH domain